MVDVFVMLTSLFWAFLEFALHHGVGVWAGSLIIWDVLEGDFGSKFGVIWRVVDDVEGEFIHLGEILGGHPLLVGYEHSISAR